nr:hypothetical protein [Bacteroidota bacterium]
MMTTFFKAAAITCFTCFLYVIPISLTTIFLCHDLFQFNVDLHIVLMLVLGCISCITLNVIINPLIYLFDNKAMMTQTSTRLFHRYMPIYAAPYSIIFAIVFYEGGIDKEFLVHVFSIMVISYANLIAFVKNICVVKKEELK